MKIGTKCSLIDVAYALVILAIVYGVLKLIPFGVDLALAKDDWHRYLGIAIIAADLICIMPVLSGADKLRDYVSRRLTGTA